jgi:hypothetical protein
MKRMLSRETLPRSPKKATSRKPGPHGTRLSEGVEPQITRLKRRPSLFLRIFNRTLEQNQSYLGHKLLVQDRPSSLNSIPERSSIFSFSLFTADDIGHHHPRLVEEVLQHFGSDLIKAQLVFSAVTKSTKPGASAILIHHPMNIVLLEARHAKMERERIFHGRVPTWTKKSFLSLRKSRLSSASKIRVFNRHGEDWKLLEFSKMATPKIGDGQLSLAGEFPTSKCSQTLTNEIHF